MRKSGLSLIEVVVVLGIILMVSLMTTPSVRHSLRQVQVTRCSGQLHEIGVALLQYRLEHQGRNPWPLKALTPGYLKPQSLICPFVAAMKPEVVTPLLQSRAGSSYFLYSQRGIDRLREKGSIGWSYTEVLAKRKDDTPLVICYNHRELKLPTKLELADRSTWMFPESPLVVLRWGGRVEVTHKGGVIADHTSAGPLQDLLTL